MATTDLIVRGGLVADGTGGPLRRADVAIAGDRVVAVGQVPNTGGAVLDAEGCVVAPGFINVLSHAYGTLQQDPRGLSDLYQGVTTEVFGEGISLGPVRGKLTDLLADEPQEPGVRTAFPHLRDFLDHLQAKGVGPNVASFVGAHNLRLIHAGADARALTEAELAEACALLDEELRAGALGVGSALIYAPGNYASTEELAAWARVLARHDALYISHIRDEGSRLLPAIEELISIARTTGARAEIYHLKAAGRENWSAMGDAIDLVESARAEGMSVTADMYPYEAGSTSLAACIPPRFHDGGRGALLRRLGDQATREAIKRSIAEPAADWQNLYLDSGGADGVMILGGVEPQVSGKTLAAVSRERHDHDPIDTLLDLIRQEPDQMAAYFIVSERNIRLGLQRPWVSVCSDSEAPSAEAPFNKTPTHPRAYGAFARTLGRYVRDGVLPLPEAIRRATSLPADTLRLVGRGVLREGSYADVAIFDPAVFADCSTYADPHRYAVGMRHVLINGVVVFTDGAPTGQLSGRALRRGRAGDDRVG